MERFFTYFSIKFDNLYLKWNFLRSWLWKWKKWILFYERLPSQIILIENTKLFFFFFFFFYYKLSNKKCVYIIKKRTYVYIYMCGSYLNKCISVALGPPNKNSWFRPCLPDFIFSTTTTIKLTCRGQYDKLNADPKALWWTWAMAMTQTCTKRKWERKREIGRWANLGLDSGYGSWRRSRCDGGWIETERGKRREKRRDGS